MKKSINVIFLLFISFNLFSKNYYIDALGGNDSNNGNSIALAWKSLTKVNATIFASGDSVFFKSGCTWTEQLYPKGSGSIGNPIVISKFGTGNLPCINGNGMTGTGVMYLYNQQCWEITNLEITNDAASAGDRRGVRIEVSDYGTANHIYLKNLNVHNIKGTVGQSRANKRTSGIGFGIVSVANQESHFNDILVDGCTIQSCDNQGLIFECVSGDGFQPGTPEWASMKITNAVVRNNTISNISKNAMIIRLFDGGLVEHNLCFNTANGITGNTIFTAGCLNTVFQFNEGYSNNSPDYDGSLYDADLRSPGTIWQYSYSHDNAHGLFWNCTVQEDDSIICRYNISQNDHGIIFCVNYPVSKINIYNNSVYIPAEQSPIIISERNNGSGTRTYNFNNNIIYNNSATSSYIITSGTSYSRNIDHNCFYGNHPANEPSDANEITSDPLFVNPGSGGIGLNTVDGYKLQKNSPCINAGILIPNNGGRDYWGNLLTDGKTDIGANEYSALTTLSENSALNKPQILTEMTDSGDLKIKIKNIVLKSKINIKIVAMDGKILQITEFNPVSEIRFKLNSAIQKGQYFIVFKSEGLTESRKIIIR